MRLFFIAMLCSSCTTTKPNEESLQRTVKVCAYNGLTAWMKPQLYLNVARICYENEKTQEVDL